MSAQYPPCPKCKSTLTYDFNDGFACPECGYEWEHSKDIVEPDTIEKTRSIKDSNGIELHDGDSVVVIKDLPVKGFSKNIKAGTKVKNIRLTDGDHNIDCKIEGFGAMALKSEFVKKA